MLIVCKCVNQVYNVFCLILLQLSDNTFKNFYYPEPEHPDSESDEEGTLAFKVKQAIAKKRPSNSIDAFFEKPPKKVKPVKRSSNVSQGTHAGVSYLSSGKDDGAYASHLIKIEIYDLEKVRNIAPENHWKHADIRLKSYVTTDQDPHLETVRDVIYSMTKDIAEKDTCVKYFIKKWTKC